MKKTFGGPTILAGMLWVMGPSAIGFALLLTCGVAWTVITWRDKLAESSFELSTDRPG